MIDLLDNESISQLNSHIQAKFFDQAIKQTHLYAVSFIRCLLLNISSDKNSRAGSCLLPLAVIRCGLGIGVIISTCELFHSVACDRMI
jgi:hypothetical protein